MVWDGERRRGEKRPHEQVDLVCMDMVISIITSNRVHAMRTKSRQIHNPAPTCLSAAPTGHSLFRVRGGGLDHGNVSGDDDDGMVRRSHRHDHRIITFSLSHTVSERFCPRNGKVVNQSVSLPESPAI